MYNFIAHVNQEVDHVSKQKKIEIKHWKVSLKTELLNITQFPKLDV